MVFALSPVARFYECDPAITKKVMVEDSIPTITLQDSVMGDYQPSTYAKISGATIVASLSTMKRGVVGESLPQVIFSLGTAPEYEP